MDNLRHFLLTADLSAFSLIVFILVIIWRQIRFKEKEIDLLKADHRKQLMDLSHKRPLSTKESKPIEYPLYYEEDMI